MRHCVGHYGQSVGSVVAAAVILKPCGVGTVLVQILRADTVVLAGHHAAEPGEIAFNLIGIGAVR